MDNYTDKNKMKLGFGLMRLPKLEDGSIDVEQTKEMVDLFLKAVKFFPFVIARYNCQRSGKI